MTMFFGSTSYIYKSFKHYKVGEIERKYKIQNTKYK
jgi:hypothetical protein